MAGFRNADFGPAGTIVWQRGGRRGGPKSETGATVPEVLAACTGLLQSVAPLGIEQRVGPLEDSAATALAHLVGMDRAFAALVAAYVGARERTEATIAYLRSAEMQQHRDTHLADALPQLDPIVASGDSGEPAEPDGPDSTPPDGPAGLRDRLAAAIGRSD